jgi:hypothetical protein
VPKGPRESLVGDLVSVSKLALKLHDALLQPGGFHLQHESRGDADPQSGSSSVKDAFSKLEIILRESWYGLRGKKGTIRILGVTQSLARVLGELVRFARKVSLGFRVQGLRGR